jgi:hypothetical protein
MTTAPYERLGGADGIAVLVDDVMAAHLVISYATEATNTAALLEKTRAGGYTAHLVGM